MKTSVNIQSQYDYCDGIGNSGLGQKSYRLSSGGGFRRLKSGRRRVFLDTYQLFDDNNGKYFEYGVMCDRIYLDEFYN